MQTKSRNGKFTISVSDTAKTVDTCEGFPKEEDYEEQIDVNINAIEGENPTLADLSETIEEDCFYHDTVGLQLLANALNCNVTVGARKYIFKVYHYQSTEDYLQTLAEQLTL